MDRSDIGIISGQVPWIDGFGAIDDSMCPGGWYEALAEMTRFGWRLSLDIDSNGKIINKTSGGLESRIGITEFVIQDAEIEPKFDVRDVKTPAHIESTFNKQFKHYLGEYEFIKEEDIVAKVETAQQYLSQGKPKEAYQIFRNVGLSLYYTKQNQCFTEKAKSHFEGVDFEHFMASEYARIKNDANVTSEDIIKYMSDYDFGNGDKFSYQEIVDNISNVEEKIKNIVPTIDKYRLKGEKNKAEYTPERTKLHIKILKELIYDNLEKYIPEQGEAPTFILLGGRGGSGKSKFKNMVYNDNFVVLDADIIKEKLPEYKGWNAAEVHEESSDILEQALLICQNNGLNVVVDATMNSAKSVDRRLQLFKDEGYQTEAHYMFLPPQKSAQRAVARFLQGGETGRYVPIDIVLSNKTNEQNFDTIKNKVDAWSFWNGDVEWGETPYLLASNGKNMSYMEKRRNNYLFDLSDKMFKLETSNLQLKNFNDLVQQKLTKILSGERK